MYNMSLIHIYSELIHIEGNTYIMDTPGFSSLNIPGLSAEDLWKYYEEFLPYEENCRFQGCSHIHEPDCGIKAALKEGRICLLYTSQHQSSGQSSTEMQFRE